MIWPYGCREAEFSGVHRDRSGGVASVPWRSLRSRILISSPSVCLTTKAQFSFGWDFSPRLLTTGIWDDLRLVTARSVYAEDLWAYGEPLRPATDPTPARWHLRLRLMRWVPTTIRVEISLRPENFDQAGYQSLTRTVELCATGDSPCTSDYDFDLDMAAARRWWPWDQGEPCLYRVTVRLFDEQGMLDEISQIAAVRSVRRTELLGDPWQFVVNDRPVFVRGANWVPADVLPGRLRDAQYVDLLRRAREAGANFLRVWGGGLREKTAFWDGCDRLGIMAWQEFPLACDFFHHYARDAGYLALLASEAHGIVRALRGHPSLIAWCGGNEINLEREDLPLRRISEVLAEDDPTRLWIPASPVDGDVHQWDVWHGMAPWTDLAAMQAPFMSEFGLQALPNAETIAEMFGGAPPRSLTDHRWGQRKAQVSKLLHYAGPAAHGALESAISATQRVQAAALKVGLEAARLRRPRKRSGEEAAQFRDAFCGGVAFWQLNEPWPAVSWSVIDAAGRPKAAYYAICQSYQPLLVAARFPWRPYAAGDDVSGRVLAGERRPAHVGRLLRNRCPGRPDDLEQARHPPDPGQRTTGRSLDRKVGGAAASPRAAAHTRGRDPGDEPLRSVRSSASAAPVANPPGTPADGILAQIDSTFSER